MMQEKVYKMNGCGMVNEEVSGRDGERLIKKVVVREGL